MATGILDADMERFADRFERRSEWILYREVPDAELGKAKKRAGWKKLGGGATVHINTQGTIDAGCAGLQDQDVDELGEGEDPENRARRKHRQDVAEHLGIKGHHIPKGQVGKLDDMPHPETGKKAPGAEEPAPPTPNPAPQPTGPQTVTLGNRPYHVQQTRGTWFFQLAGHPEAGWTQASAGMAKMIQDSLGPTPAEPATSTAPAPEQKATQKPAAKGKPSGKPKGESGGKTIRTINDAAEEYGVNPEIVGQIMQYVAPPRVERVTKAGNRYFGSGTKADHARRAAEATQRIAQFAEENQLEPSELADAAAYLLDEYYNTAENREQKRALEYARKYTGLYKSTIDRLEEAGKDYSHVRDLDVKAIEVARQHPELGLGSPDDPKADLAGDLWQLLKESATIPYSTDIDDSEVLLKAVDVARAYGNQQAAPSEYEEVPFAARSEGGWLEKYAQWRAKHGCGERLVYAYKSAHGQQSLFDQPAATAPKNPEFEAAHPRDHGKFAEKPGAQGEAQSQTTADTGKAATADERAAYDRYVAFIGQSRSVKPSTFEQWVGNYRTIQARKAQPKPPSKPAEKAAESSPAAAKPEPPPAEEPKEEPAEPAKPPAAETPREKAQDLFERQKNDDYAYARTSAIPNAGQDLVGSARHKANAWRSLEEAERDGTAADLVTRDKLLKNEPHGLIDHAGRNPMSALVMHMALKAFSPKPGYGSRTPTPEVAKKNRAQYVDAYRRIKEKAEEVAKTEDDPKKACRALGTLVHKLIQEYRGMDSESLASRATAADRYNATANSLVDLHSKLNDVYRKTSIVRKASEFARDFSQKQEDASPKEKRDRLVETVSQVLEGASINEALGKAGEAKAKTFNPAEMYVKVAKREGGAKVAETPLQGRDFLLDKAKMRGLQFGNYVTDEERQHHLMKAAEAFSDMADVLQIPEEYLSWKGKLGIAFGARGRAGALAHYEPSLKVINLTRASGAGSLAHEWAHFFDNALAAGDTEGMIDASTGKPAGPAHFIDDMGIAYTWSRTGGDKKIDKTDDPMWKAFEGVRQAWQSSGFQSRLHDLVHDLTAEGRMSDAKAAYWKSRPEILARCFERYVQHKLQKAGRKNTYLAGIETKAYKEGGLWPTDEEIAQMAPAFDKVFEAFKDGIEKKRYALAWDNGPRLVRLAERFDTAIERVTSRNALPDAERFASRFEEACERLCYAKHKPSAGQKGLWDEESHPRGQPGNAGEFVRKGAESVPQQPASTAGQAGLFGKDDHAVSTTEPPKSAPPAGKPKQLALLHGLNDAPGQQDLWNMDKAEEEKPKPAAAHAEKHGADTAVVNLPLDKRGSGSLDSQIDKWKKDKAASGKQQARTSAAKNRDDKQKARALFEQHGDSLATSTAAKSGHAKKDVLKTLDSMVKWEPEKAIKLFEQYAAENPKPAEPPKPSHTATNPIATLYHGSPAKRDEIQPGSMLTADAAWSAGYTTKVDMNKPGLPETFTGAVHEVPVYSQKPHYVEGSVHKAEEELLHLAKGGQYSGGLKGAAEYVASKYGIDAIVSRKNGAVTGAIVLKPHAVTKHHDPAEILSKEPEHKIPDNLKAALKSHGAKRGEPKERLAARFDAALERVLYEHHSTRQDRDEFGRWVGGDDDGAEPVDPPSRPPAKSKAKKPADLITEEWLRKTRDQINALDYKADEVLGEVDGCEVHVVDGDAVQVEHDMDFVCGGNHERWPWVPENELWIDGRVDSDDWPFILLHEAVERRLMAEGGLEYDEAHELANQHERRWRQEQGDDDEEDSSVVDEDSSVLEEEEEDEDLAAEIARAAAETDTDPSEAQKEAGNYAKGKFRWNGLEIAIENPKGGYRSGKGWRVKMPAHYGYFKLTESDADGDHVDVFVGPDPHSDKVFVVDQLKKDGETFDEHKCIIGCHDAEEAKDLYLSAYSDDWKSFGGITELSVGKFKEWLEEGKTDKPIAYQVEEEEEEEKEGDTSKTRLIALYGTFLQNPHLLIECLGEVPNLEPDAIEGHLRAMHWSDGDDWPTLVEREGSSQPCLVIEATPTEARKLLEWEDHYSERPVKLASGRKAVAFVYAGEDEADEEDDDDGEEEET